MFLLSNRCFVTFEKTLFSFLFSAFPEISSKSCLAKILSRLVSVFLEIFSFFPCFLMFFPLFFFQFVSCFFLFFLLKIIYTHFSSQIPSCFPFLAQFSSQIPSRFPFLSPFLVLSCLVFKNWSRPPLLELTTATPILYCT